ncbi:MAG: hypothetical protein EA399_16275 [Desulfovibrionales bacterium]|nr:MAG: hypothetical protein EA399_16275 [Desulfovibrionales bacterium]
MLANASSRPLEYRMWDSACIFIRLLCNSSLYSAHPPQSPIQIGVSLPVFVIANGHGRAFLAWAVVGRTVSQVCTLHCCAYLGWDSQIPCIFRIFPELDDGGTPTTVTSPACPLACTLTTGIAGLFIDIGDAFYLSVQVGHGREASEHLS